MEKSGFLLVTLNARYKIVIEKITEYNVQDFSIHCDKYIFKSFQIMVFIIINMWCLILFTFDFLACGKLHIIIVVKC